MPILRFFRPGHPTPDVRAKFLYKNRSLPCTPHKYVIEKRMEVDFPISILEWLIGLPHWRNQVHKCI